MVRPRQIHDRNRKSTQCAGCCQCCRKAVHHFSNAPHTDESNVYRYPSIQREDIGIRVPAIIDKELFDRVQIQVGKNKCVPARNKPLNDQYLLTTKLFCAQCGSTMSGISGISKNGSKYQYYSCTNRSNKRAAQSTTSAKKSLKPLL